MINKKIMQLLLLFIITTPASAASYLKLYVGQVQTVKIGKVTRVAIGQSSLVKANVLDDGQVLLIPTKEGETDIKFWTKKGSVFLYKVTVLKANMHSRRVIAQSLLRTFPRLKVKAVDKHIIVEGKISSVDHKVYQRVIKNIPNVIDLVNPGKFNEYQLRKLLSAFTVSGIVIRKAGQRIVVGGEIDPRDFEAFKVVLSKIPNVTSLIRPKPFAQEKMVRLKVTVAEVSSNYVRSLGIKWDPDARGPIAATVLPIISNNQYAIVPSGDEIVDWVDALNGVWPSSGSGFMGLTTSIGSKLNYLSANGKSRILASPELMARSKTEAKFHSGGEVPIVYSDGEGGQNVKMYPYGVDVSMKPVVDSSNNIVLQDLSVKVSDLDPSNPAGGVPAFLDRSIKTTINARHGVTVAISGLLKVNTASGRDKIPFIADLPIIGHLFKTKNISNIQSELIILVTPELVTQNNLNNISSKLQDEIYRLEKNVVPVDQDIAGEDIYTDLLE